MRIDLVHGARRPLPMRMVFWLIRRYIDHVPGPLLAMTHRPQFVPMGLWGFVSESLGKNLSWKRGDAELFGAFVSNLNRCHF